VKVRFEKNSSRIAIEKLGFGTWGLGGDAYGHVSNEEVVNLLRNALSLGIKWFDTAPLYGNGKVEALIGQVFQGTPKDSFKIVTKAGLFTDQSGQEQRNFKASFISESMRESLDRLGLIYLDFLLLHSPSVAELNENLLEIETLFKSKLNKEVKFLGISLKNPINLVSVVRKNHISCAEFNFSLMDQRALSVSELLSNQIKYRFARTPYNFGFLTDNPPTYDNSRKEHFHLRNWPKEQFERWELFRLIWKKIAEENSLSLQTLALSFVLSSPEVDVVFPGIMNINQLEQSLAIARLGILSKESLQDLREIYSLNESNFTVTK